MDIKIVCPCGQKTAFSVEPVGGRMPVTIACPRCNADITAPANQVIAGLLQPLAAVPLPEGFVPPTGAPQLMQATLISGPVPAAMPAPALAPVRLAPVHAPAVASPAPAPVAAAVPASAGAAAAAHPGVTVAEGKLGLKFWFWVILAVTLTFYNCGSKMYRRFSSLKNLVQSVSSAAEDADKAGDDWTLPSDNGIMLIVKHPDEGAVAEACVEYAQSQPGKKLMSEKVANLDGEWENAEFLVHPVYKGSVQIDGSIFWEIKDIARVQGLAEHLSRKFGVMAVSALMGDDADVGYYTVFDKGEKKFRLDLSYQVVKDDLQQIVKIEGEEWANSTGFKPGGNGYKEFDMYDANSLTHHLGMTLHDRPEGGGGIVLKVEKGR